MSRIISIAALYLILFLSAIAALAEEPAADKTLSPYFLVNSADSTVRASLPLRSTSASVKIAGVIAEVKVTQVYANTGKDAIEAIYVFPASTRAAVNGLTMTIGDRTIRAVIKEREQARQEYETARSEGKSATLLEQDRPNVFTMSVANILPGDEIKVELCYTELLTPTEGFYEFVYPTVVGPRYSNKTVAGADSHDSFLATPYLHEGEAPTYTFDLAVNLAAGMPIRDIICATHKVRTSYAGVTAARVALDPSEKQGGNRDFVLRFRLAGEQAASGLLLYKGETENFFLMMVQPPQRVAAAQVPPREYIFIMDVSGSMQGFPLEVSKKLMRNLLVTLRSEDQFNLILFAGNSAVLGERSVPATAANIERAVNFLQNADAGGGTELLPALQRALALPRLAGVSRSVVLVTDGYVAIEKEAMELISRNLDKTNVFAFGIGSSVNRALIEGVARAGMGEPFVVEDQAAADGQAERFRQYVSTPVLTGMKVKFDGFQAYDVTPPTLPDLFAARPVVVFGKWRGSLAGRITVSGLAGVSPWQEEIKVAEYGASEENAALRQLWARSEIARLDDYSTCGMDTLTIQRVTRLGLDYSLLTAYTSFVAVDQIVRRDSEGKLITVPQALPLPAGVENSAVGFDLSFSGAMRHSAGLNGLWIGLLLFGALSLAAGVAACRSER